MAKKLKHFDRCTVTNLHSTGDMVAQTDQGLKILTDARYTLPGEIISANTGTRKRKGLYEARDIQVLESVPYRQEPFCPHFGYCGGCRWQLAPYTTQVQWKHEQLQKWITNALPDQEIPLEQPLPSPQWTEYRNKMEYSFSARRWRTPDEMDRGHTQDFQDEEPQVWGSNNQALGLFVPGTPGKVLDIYQCSLQDSKGNDLRNGLRTFALDQGMEFFESRKLHGYLRTLVIRNTTMGQWLVMIITAFDDAQAEATLREFCQTSFPWITSFYFLTNPKPNDSYQDCIPRHQYGQEWIAETLDGLEFHIGPLSFFQTNLYQTPRLYKLVEEYAEIEPHHLVYDLYTGTGTIAAYLARKAKKVIGIEYVAEATEAATRACLENGLENTEFYAGDMKDLLVPGFFESHGKPDVIVCDPPRAGMHPQVVENILLALPERIVYVSCNPQSLAKDLAKFHGSYQITRLISIDMAPQTPHGEAIAQLTRRK